MVWDSQYQPNITISQFWLNFQGWNGAHEHTIAETSYHFFLFNLSNVFENLHNLVTSFFTGRCKNTPQSVKVNFYTSKCIEESEI